MQTFLPYESFEESASVLDRQRLGKQRVEVMQILKALTGEKEGWKNHPATKMWAENIQALGFYGKAICEEWISRGYVDNCLPKIERLSEIENIQVYVLPTWIGSSIHITHQSNLIRKDPDFYGPKFPGVKDDLEYYWPVK